MRDIILNSIFEKMKKNKKIFFLTADMGINLVEKFNRKFPDRYANVGISEQNLIGIAAGLCKIGFRPFLYTISNFIVHRCFEQIRNDIILHKLPITLIGTSAGFDNASLGPTHHVIDDWGALKTFPEMQIYCPSSTKYASKIVNKIIKQNKPSYIRIPKGDFSKINTVKDIYYLKSGSRKNLLISYGYGAEICLKAYNLNKSSALICNKLHPLNASMLKNIINKYKNIIIFEDQLYPNNLFSSFSNIFINNNKNIKFHNLSPKYYELKNGNNKEYYLKLHNIDERKILKLL